MNKLLLPLALALAAFAATAADFTEAEVRKVDKPAAKLTLRHGEIKSLDMPAMTMVFGVKDPALLDAVKSGDKAAIGRSLKPVFDSCKGCHDKFRKEQ